jgi:hypothetical protein
MPESTSYYTLSPVLRATVAERRTSARSGHNRHAKHLNSIRGNDPDPWPPSTSFTSGSTSRRVLLTQTTRGTTPRQECRSESRTAYKAHEHRSKDNGAARSMPLTSTRRLVESVVAPSKAAPRANVATERFHHASLRSGPDSDVKARPNAVNSGP